MRFLSLGLTAMVGIMAAGQALAEEQFVPEKVTVLEKIKPGPNVFAVDQSWDGASRINVVGAKELDRKGILSVGLVTQFILTKDRKTAYTASAYAKRITSGPTEAVLQEFDVDTMSAKREIIISEKMAQVAPQKSLLQLSADEKYAFVQNATPATSVTVVDLAAGKPIAEVPTPGCWSVHPATSGLRFTTLCGDGTMQTFTVKADGSFGAPEKSEKIFDSDTDALYAISERAGENLVFLSFKGNVYTVADKDGPAKLVDKFSITEGKEGAWAPGGIEVMTYNAANDILFVAMHPDAKEGSHKDAAHEIWPVDLSTKTVLYRSVVEGVKSISVTQGKEPVLFGLNDDEGILTRYDIDPATKFAARLSGKVESVGKFAALVYAGE
ncbi:methylamine dehydrogenase heavy chain [Pararhizobium capsulatum DSM 1112]|uniref:Methylamine dehydrogenase heavy chain n=1 Tax=Pararhizobium capsulatum DSM 1112 TaxID=1121113 RepID=A0ABU0BYE6_9HYPH|nr:amine dehydrogenase large subunit [Pararhizobium capsulatum]MDQ0322734.1 methylamine dehydrogenase heavy chain [Pararhizobium capsulatum DSM 1112]